MKPSNSMVGLLALYFALGYTVAKVTDSDPEKSMMAPITESATVSAQVSPSQPVAQAPQVQPAAANPAPAPAIAAKPAPAPAIAAKPAPAPAIAAKPAPAPAVAAKPAPVAKPSPTPVTKPTPSTPTSSQIWRVRVNAEDAQLGPKNAPMTVVFFSAFGCGTCTTFKDAPKKLVEKYGDKVRIVFKHKVIPASAPDSIEASVAALAAKEQGKFWEFHDKLFETNALDPSSLVSHAKALGLNVAKFSADLKRSDLRGQALKDALLANEVGAHSMPNIMVNGERMKGAKTFENLVTLTDAVLPKAEKALASGEKADGYYDRVVSTGKAFDQLETRKIVIDDTGAAILGKKDAPITLAVYEDFQCPFCAKISPALKAFYLLNKDKVRIVFKHMPLSSIHPEAQLASEAAKEAQAQGKFWEYHDALFDGQKALDRASLDRYAQTVGLDMTKFKAALDGRVHQAAVQRDASEGQRNGVTGTPSVYLNGRKYQGPRGYPPEGLEAVSRAYLGMD
jgi:protein-disulfide isomerase